MGTEAALAPHGAEEVGHLLIDLEGATGRFSRNIIDYRMPCTAAEDTTCQIVPHLSLWNEFLWWLHLELRELSETGRQLGLAIRKICLLYWPASPLRCFIGRLRAGIFKNRTLCSATIGDFHERNYEEWADDWFAVCDTARRNSGFVARAAQFLNHARCDRLCAAGLDRVSRHPALVAELAEVLSIDKVEAARVVRQKWRCIEGLHDFMRLAGVVKEQVTCLPRQDGRTQLDGLNQDCWAHVRRYLELDDVAYGTAPHRRT
ncbi:hypothetical protein HPB49_024565 [Dermacentor silvarum]|uniref:Uncharacterized protein n=1 Tax=Dermacentor silvarum TaxID=543639 RepID=A0ACB8CTS8_DERSI|nr:hypothetical protein HPB49_024565 [Dermacentor silvarum]